MQPGPARSRWRRWLRWGRVILLGLVLGGVQIALAVDAPSIVQWTTTGWWLVAISACCYLVLPVIEGFFAAMREEDTFSGISAGCLVGAISVLVTASPLVALTVIAFNTPQPVCPPACPRFLPLGDTYAGITIIVVVYTGAFAEIGGVLGGWIGSTLGQKWASMARQHAAAPPATQPGRATGGR
jgi:hypothetical protein